MAGTTILQKPGPDVATPYRDPAISARWFSGQRQGPALGRPRTRPPQTDRRPSELPALAQAAVAKKQAQGEAQAKKAAEFQALQAKAHDGPNHLAANPNAPVPPAAPIKVAQAPKPAVQGLDPGAPPFNPANVPYKLPEERDPPLVPLFNPSNVPYVPLEERELLEFLRPDLPLKPNSKLQAGLVNALDTPMVSRLPVAPTISQRIQALNAGMKGLNIVVQAANTSGGQKVPVLRP
jgi:hypothetical protein